MKPVGAHIRSHERQSILTWLIEVEEEEDEDNMEEISTENIISGRRTRGTKDIDYAKAAAEAEDLEDDEDDDDDFQAQEDDAMQE